MTLELFTLPLPDVTRTGYLIAEYKASATGITLVSFLVAGMGKLERSYLEAELRLNNTLAYAIMADANSASDGTNTKFTYITNNIGHTLFKQMNLHLNGIVNSAQTNTYAYSTFLETLFN